MVSSLLLVVLYRITPDMTRSSFLTTCPCRAPGESSSATFLVHPDHVIEKRARTIYRVRLEHLARMREDRRLRIAMPSEVDRWWRQRSQMRIVPDNRTPHIEGEGKERARLAVATLTGETVVFTLEGP